MTSPGKLSGKRVILLPLTEKSRRRPPQIMQGQGKFGFICPDKIFRATSGTTPVQMGCLVATRAVEGPSLITQPLCAHHHFPRKGERICGLQELPGISLLPGGSTPTFTDFQGT